MKKLYNNFTYIFALVVIAYLPFQSLIERFLEASGLSSSVAFWLSNWYEIAIGLLLILSLVVIVRGNPRTIKTSREARRVLENWPTIALCLLGLLSIIFFSASKTRGVEGFKFDLLPIVAFLIVSVSALAKDQKAKLVKTYLVVAVILAAWALLERFLPLNYWSHLGLSNFGFGQFGFGRFSFGPIYQSASFIGGPNQLASYLLPAIFITLCCPELVSASRNAFDKILQRLILAVIILAVLFTFSRSAWIGLAVGLLVYAFIYAKENTRRLSAVISITAIIVLVVLFKYSGAVKDVLLHTGGGETASSTSAHATALNTTAEELKTRLSRPADLVFGTGLGSAGPLVLKYGNGIIPESWYAQILFELGILGLAAWLYFIVQLLFKYFRTNPGLFLSIIAISVASLFLHTWADNPAVAITLFVLAGAHSITE